MSWIKNNLVAIVMIPSIIAMHYGWTALQSVDELVPPDQRRPEGFNVPLEAVATVYEKITGKTRGGQ